MSTPRTSGPQLSKFTKSSTKELCVSHQITPQDLSTLTACETAVPNLIDGLIEKFYEWLETQPQFPQFFPNKKMVELVKVQQAKYWSQFFAGVVDDDYVSSRIAVGELHAKIGLPIENYIAAMNFSGDYISRQIYTSKLSQADSNATILAKNKLLSFDTMIVIGTYHHRTNDLLAIQNRAVMELSTPVIKIWPSIVMLPLIGVIDTGRAQQIIERLLESIVSNEARVAILDVSGVSTIDTNVAQHLMKTVTSATMLGAHVIVTGISPDASQTLTNLGVNLGEMKTMGNLQNGIREAFKQINRKVVPS